MKEFIVSAASEQGANPIVPNIWDTILVLLGFLILLILAWKVVVPNFEKTFAARTEAIEGGIAKAEAAQAEATQALESYKSQLADARAEANRIREEARSEGAQILADLKNKANAEAKRISEQAQVQIAADREAALVSLRAEVGTLATGLAGKIVGEALTDDERATRVVDRFLADLESEAPA